MGSLSKWKMKQFKTLFFFLFFKRGSVNFEEDSLAEVMAPKSENLVIEAVKQKMKMIMLQTEGMKNHSFQSVTKLIN